MSTVIVNLDVGSDGHILGIEVLEARGASRRPRRSACRTGIPGVRRMTASGKALPGLSAHNFSPLAIEAEVDESPHGDVSPADRNSDTGRVSSLEELLSDPVARRFP